MRLLPKTRLGTYEILASLGAGGMGEVYRARDLRLDREVALKVLSADVAASAERLARFEREARTAAGLNHPNIVTLFSVEEEDGIRFLTMELVDGQPLSGLVVPGGLPLSRVLDLAIPLAEALAAAHERGVVHRDLKPANVMVNRDGRVKVLDFGLAKNLWTEDPASGASLAATVASPLSEQGQVFGTVPYMAPEQLRGEPVDARADLFALGIILYELATGRRPFAGASNADIGSAILRDEPLPLTSVRADLPGELAWIVSRCLEKNPADRPGSVLFVLHELRALFRVQENAASAKPVAPEAPSVAVLPFVNRSRSEEDEYFSDGLADELLNLLAKIRGLRVAARTSSFHFKGKDCTLAEMGQALHVATVLEGSVRKAGQRVRISVQLVKVADGYHLWSETYDRTLDDIFAVQDDIAQAVVKELRTTLLGEEPVMKASGQVRGEVARAARGRGTNPEAHRLYLQARYLLGQMSHEGLTNGIEYLQQALELEPEFAVAWAELGRSFATAADRAWIPLESGYREARQAAERALALEPDLAEAHELIGWIRMSYDWDWHGAETSYRRALELAPGSAGTLRGAGVLACSLGRLEEGIALYRQASEQDPLSVPVLFNLGWALRAADRLAESERTHRKVLELSPHANLAACYVALSLLPQGRAEEALAMAEREPAGLWRLYALALVYPALGRRNEADAVLRELTEQHAAAAATQIAEVHAARGEIDAAFTWLDRAYAQRDGGLADLRMLPFFRPLHGDPRWGAFLEKMGF